MKKIMEDFTNKPTEIIRKISLACIIALFALQNLGVIKDATLYVFPLGSANSFVLSYEEWKSNNGNCFISFTVAVVFLLISIYSWINWNFIQDENGNNNDWKI